MLLALGLVGCAMTLGSAMNGLLSRRVGVFGSVCIFLVVGSFLALVITVLTGQIATLVPGLIAMPRVYLVPGIINIGLIATALKVLTVAGASTAVTGAFAGQMLGGLLLDQSGAFGQPEVRLSMFRLIGAAITVVGLRLVLLRRITEGTSADARLVLIWSIAAFLLGAVVSVVHSLNAGVGKQVGPVGAALVFFLPGALLLTVLWLGDRLGYPMHNVRNAAWWALVLPGTINFLFVWLIVRAVSVLGVSTVVAVTFLMQMAAALVIDHWGLFTMPHFPVTWWRVSGALIMLSGVYLVYG